MGAVIYHADRPEPLWQALAETELARKNGIFAHYTFLKQDDILELLYTELTGKQAYTAAVRPALYRLLGSEDFKTTFPHIAAYYDVANEQEAHLKRIQLAGKTADLLDQYQVYRSVRVLEWEALDSACQEQDHQAWQRWLWLALRDRFKWYVPAQDAGRGTASAARRDGPGEGTPVAASAYTVWHFYFHAVLYPGAERPGASHRCVLLHGASRHGNAPSAGV